MCKATYIAVASYGRIIGWDIFNGWTLIASVRTRREARAVVRLING